MASADERIARAIAANVPLNKIKSMNYAGFGFNAGLTGGVGYGLHRYAANRPGQSHNINHALQGLNIAGGVYGLGVGIQNFRAIRRL
jgi:hypothetical protein